MGGPGQGSASCGSATRGIAVDADGKADPGAGAADLTGILRAGPGGDRLATWPGDLRVIARRFPRPAGKQARLGEDADWEYGAFATSTAAGQVRWLERPPPHPGPRGRPGQAVQGLRRGQPALDRLRPQRRLAAAGRPRDLADRVAASRSPGR